MCPQRNTTTFSTPLNQNSVQYSNVQEKWKIIITDTSELPCKQDTEQTVVGIQRSSEAHTIPEINVDEYPPGEGYYHSETIVYLWNPQLKSKVQMILFHSKYLVLIQASQNTHSMTIDALQAMNEIAKQLKMLKHTTCSDLKCKTKLCISKNSRRTQNSDLLS